MTKSEKDRKTERMEIRTCASFIAAIDDWRRKQPHIPSRTKALETLALKGLALEDERSNGR